MLLAPGMVPVHSTPSQLGSDPYAGGGGVKLEQHNPYAAGVRRREGSHRLEALHTQPHIRVMNCLVSAK